ncbi:hypothetical protein A2U01_0112911 [Trifolium medium]|uniref:Uncharacterized protein n=1 Tax=Trifolium medium TaxID=97028 RepID=A0A392VUL1_9FABA|nr:hypothetical protein [Trifolium medium]
MMETIISALELEEVNEAAEENVNADDVDGYETEVMESDGSEDI